MQAFCAIDPLCPGTRQKGQMYLFLNNYHFFVYLSCCYINCTVCLGLLISIDYDIKYDSCITKKYQTINNELQRMWKEVVVTKPKSLLWHLIRQQKTVRINRRLYRN